MSSTPPSFPPEQAQSYGPLPNYLIWAILITIAGLCLCCIFGAIPGIVAIVFASQVNSKLAAGDRAGAEHASKQAKLWCQITTGLCIFGLLLKVGMHFGGYDQYWMNWAEQLNQHR
jgi:hypothetical protein